MDKLLDLILLFFRDILNINRKKISPVVVAIANFVIEKQDRLRSIPIWTNPFIQSAESETVNDVPLSEVRIYVNPSFPTFSIPFQNELITHEYLHVLQAEDKDIDINKFHEIVKVWFDDPLQGLPTPDGNYTKYYLLHDLYGSGRYKIGDYPIEEYAYIGTMISNFGGRSFDVPENIRIYYVGILL
jgi:hypothetical protein